MINFMESFLEQLENINIYHYDSAKNQYDVYFILAKKQVLCVDKNTEKILHKIPYPFNITIVNDTDFGINSNSNALFFSQKNPLNNKR